ncbi:MFS general substrate transporter [Thozetella sp. PMI_491]|nr:MFS general substrate transporter [Thozetella sp. PMI_491]
MSRGDSVTVGPADQPPDGGYGWAVVGSCFVLNCFSWGVTASFGIYLSEYMSLGLVSKAGSFELGLIGGMNFTFAVLLAPLATLLTRRFGVQAVILSGSLLQGSGYVAASFATQTWHFYLSQGLLVGCGIGFMIIPSTAVLSQWFNKRRSIANGVASAGSGVGGALFTWCSKEMILRLSLAWALRITGLASVAATVVAALFVHDRNRQIRPTQLALDFNLLRRKTVVLLLLWAFITMFGYITLLFSLSDFALSVGLSSSQATDIVGFLNIGTAIGRPIIGLASDHISRIKTASTLTFICGILCFAFWVPATSFGLATTFAITCGAILGIFWMSIGPLCVEVAGLQNLQSLLFLSWVTVSIPAACTEWPSLIL